MTWMLRSLLVLVVLSSVPTHAYTDTEFAFKVAAEKKLQAKIYEYLFQTLPPQDFRVTVSASVFVQEPVNPFDNLTPTGEDLPNAFTVDDPMDLSIGVIQGRNMRDALKGRDAIIDKLKKELQDAQAPTYAGLEILQLSVWLGLADSYDPAKAKLIQDKVTAFVTETYRLTPRVFLETLLQAPSSTDKPADVRAPASFDDPAGSSLLKWALIALAAALLLSLLALLMRSRLEAKRAEKNNNAERSPPVQHLNVTTTHKTEDSPKTAPVSISDEPGPAALLAQFEAALKQLGDHLAHAQAAHVEKLVQYWSEAGTEGHRKAAVLLRTWAELMPEKPIYCPMGKEVFDTFKNWKDIPLAEQIKTTEEALWELAAVKSMGTDVLGSKLERIRKIPVSRASAFLSGENNPEASYILWGLLEDTKRQAILRELSPRTRAMLFENVWNDELHLSPETIQTSIESIDAYLDKSSDAMGGGDLEDSLSPRRAKLAFALSLDARSEVELFWPKLENEASLLSDLRKETLNLSTLMFLKEEFWTYPELLPDETEFVSLAKILGKEAAKKILEAMPTLTSRVYSSRLMKLEDPIEAIGEDFSNADSYLTRLRFQLSEQKMSPADITRETNLWSIDSLGKNPSSYGDDNRGSESA